MQEIKTIAVVGLGYVGLPLALLADRKGYHVIGIEKNTEKVAVLTRAKSYIDDISDADLEHSSVRFSDDMSLIEKAQAVIICVPTPVNADKTPNLDPVKGAVTDIAPHVQKGTLIVLESTVNPGVSDEVITPLLEKLSQKRVGTDLYLAHCPERINPGKVPQDLNPQNQTWSVANINRVIGANSPRELELAKSLYESLIDAEIRPMASIKEAEAVKVVENAFRDINIAFVNELAMSFHKLGLNVENVINGAATKPFAFMAHHPGCGVGGHCIPVDPYYLIEYAHAHEFEHQFLRLARDINEHMPQFTVELLAESVGDDVESLDGAKVTLLGLSYKEDVGDDRQSPAKVIRTILEENGANVAVFDPHMPGQSTVASLREALAHSPSIVIATGHKEFRNLRAKDLQAAGIKTVVDGRNILQHRRDELAEAGITYKGIGIN
ncbi:MAG TPA: nucleotide sugar dehydrogenase [Candidatus Saccharimonadales bacterium]